MLNIHEAKLASALGFKVETLITMKGKQFNNNKMMLNAVVKSIHKYSRDFSETQRILDIPWVEVSYKKDHRKFIFTQKNELIVSVGGNVITGFWKLIPTANCLLLTLQNKKTLYTLFFLDDALFILRIDGQEDEYFILANENKIPDLKIENYIRSKYGNPMNGDLNSLGQSAYQHTFFLSDGQTLQFVCRGNSPSPKPGDIPYIDGEIAEDGRYLLRNKKVIIEIKDQTYFRKLKVKSYRLKSGNVLKVEQDAEMGVRKGDKVWFNDRAAPDGKYQIGWLSYLKVKNGRIDKEIGIGSFF